MEYGIPLHAFVNIAALHCGWSLEDVNKNMIQCTPNELFVNIDSLRLEQIKRIVKDIKNLGYYTLQLTGNKAFFVSTLYRIVQEYRQPSTAPKPSQPINISNVSRSLPSAAPFQSKPPAAPSLPVPQSASTSTSYAPHSGNAYTNQQKHPNVPLVRQNPPVPNYNNYPRGLEQSMTGPGSASKPRPHPHANAAFAPPLQNSPPFNNGFQPRGTTVGMQSSAAPQATSSSFNPFAIVSNAEVVGDKIAPVPKPVKLSDRNAILNSREKYEVFYKLSVISGITKEEILREIQACPEREMSEDVILYRIISRKDPEAAKSIYVAPSSKAQEDAELDRAILESEKERDNIQDRKRKRTADLKTDIQCEMVSADEFKTSIVLWGAQKKNADVETKASSSKAASSSSSSSSSTSSANHNHELANAVHGCVTIKLIGLYFDHCGLEMDAIELIELVESDLAKIRCDCVDLLLLEKDALKYYKDASYPYVTALCHAIDTAAPFRTKLSTSLQNIKSHTKLNKNDYKAIEQHLRTHSKTIKEVLNVELIKFRKGLYKIPKDGGLIPEIFRRKRLIPFINMLSSQLDADGFEVVNNYASLNLLSDVENEGLEISSEEEDFSDDD